MSDCLFCKIVAGEIPSSKVYEDDVCYAFNDIDPQAPTHFLVVPKAHIGSVSEITADNSMVVAHIFEVIAKLTKEKGLDSYRVVSNIGEQAGQSVFHLHFHVLSGRDMTWPPGARESACKRFAKQNLGAGGLCLPAQVLSGVPAGLGPVGNAGGAERVSPALPRTERQRHDVASGLMRPSRGSGLSLSWRK